MEKINEKGTKLQFKNGKYILHINNKFIVENEDLDYVLKFIEEEHDSKKKVEKW